MDLKVVYVTVGTTKFDSLISEITNDQCLRALKARGCLKLILQLGTGARIDEDKIHTSYGIKVEQYDFKFESARTDMMNANLIIGHAGAGTCMDILKYGKPAVIVVNEELMNNHQTELARQLASDGYIYYCRVGDLVEALNTLDYTALKPYGSQSNIHQLVDCLNKLIR